LSDGIAILVVEDDPLIQVMVEDALGDGGFAVTVATSGDDAIGQLTSDHCFRALVTDIDLGRGRIDGWQVARRARELDPSFPVVYMTGDSAADWGVSGVPNSILLSKPFAPAQIVAAVSQLLNSGTPGATV
jgi:CheY-like chemotaxis protein